jgi:predicted glycosyltransferase involved in capsule biosynthesis
MLSPMKHVICEYRPLLMKMALDFPTIALATSNLELFCDVEILLSLVCFVPMLEIVNVLVKFAQLHDFLFVICGDGEHLAR